jgi:hypothetical protein
MPDLSLDYFQRRLLAERKKLGQVDKQNLAYNDFLYAPTSGRKKMHQTHLRTRKIKQFAEVPFNPVDLKILE